MTESLGFLSLGTSLQNPTTALQNPTVLYEYFALPNQVEVFSMRKLLIMKVTMFAWQPVLGFWRYFLLEICGCQVKLSDSGENISQSILWLHVT